LIGGKNIGDSSGTNRAGFALQNQDKKEVKLSDFAGKKTWCWCGIRWTEPDLHERARPARQRHAFVRSARCGSARVSVDSTWSHKAYAEQDGIKYSLLATFIQGAMSENTASISPTGHYGAPSPS